jgi:hypothetical protein
LATNEPDRAQDSPNPKDRDYQGENTRQVDADAAHSASLPMLAPMIQFVFLPCVATSMTELPHTGILRRRWVRVLAWIFVIGTFIKLAEQAIAILLHLFFA